MSNNDDQKEGDRKSLLIGSGASEKLLEMIDISLKGVKSRAQQLRSTFKFERPKDPETFGSVRKKKFKTAPRYMSETDWERALQKSGTPRWLLPTSRFSFGWDAMTVVMLVYVAIVVPFRAGFGIQVEADSPMFPVEVIVDTYFIADVVLNFYRPYVSKTGGELVTNRKRIAAHYLKGWFTGDVLSCLPVNYIVLLLEGTEYSDDARVLRLIKILRLSRLMKMLRLRRLVDLMDRYEDDMPTFFASFRVARLVLSIMYLAHLLACAWFLAGRYDSGEYIGWVNLDDNIHATDYSDAYVTSYYWAITTMTTVGYGDLTGETIHEKVLATVCMLIGGFVFGLIVGSINDLVTQASAGEARYNSLMREVKEYLRSKGVPKPFLKRVMAFYEQLYSAHTVYNEKKIMSSLPPTIRTELVTFLYKDTIEKVPMFKNCSSEEVEAICSKLRPVYTAKGDVITREGDQAQHMYIIRTGEIEVMQKKEYITTLHDGDFFGMNALYSFVSSRAVTTTALGFCELCVLDRKSIREIADEYPDFALIMQKASEDALGISGTPSTPSLSEDGDELAPLPSHAKKRKGGDRLGTSGRQFSLVSPVVTSLVMEDSDQPSFVPGSLMSDSPRRRRRSTQIHESTLLEEMGRPLPGITETSTPIPARPKTLEKHHRKASRKRSLSSPALADGASPDTIMHPSMDEVALADPGSIPAATASAVSAVVQEQMATVMREQMPNVLRESLSEAIEKHVHNAFQEHATCAVREHVADVVRSVVREEVGMMLRGVVGEVVQEQLRGVTAEVRALQKRVKKLAPSSSESESE